MLFRVPEFLLPEYFLSVLVLESLIELLFVSYLFVPRKSFLGVRLSSVLVVLVLPDTFSRSVDFTFSLFLVTLPRLSLFFLPNVLVLLTSDKISLFLVVVVTSLPLPNLSLVLSVEVRDVVVTKSRVRPEFLPPELPLILDI